MATQVDQYFFGSGTLTLIPPSGTPTQVGILQEVDVEITTSTKELHGSGMYPVAVAQTKAKITGKAKSGSISGGLVNAIMPGGVITSGRELQVEETIVQAGGGATVEHAADFVEDHGVIDFTDGVELVKVDSGPGPGEYSVTDGVYTFDAGADGNTLSIRYVYSVTDGSTIAFGNPQMGTQTVYQVRAENVTGRPLGQEHLGIKIWAAIFSKLTFPFKNEDFMMQDLAFEGFADNQRRTWNFYTPSVLPETE